MKQDELAEQSCDEICIHVGRILKDVMEAIVYIFSLTSIRFPFLWSPHSHPHIYINSHELIFVYNFWRVSFVCSSDADCHQTHSIANHLFNISYSFLYYQYHCVGVVVWSFRCFNTAFELSFTGKLYKTLVFEFQSCVNVTFFHFFLRRHYWKLLEWRLSSSTMSSIPTSMKFLVGWFPFLFFCMIYG